jgi:hypothetical protein
MSFSKKLNLKKKSSKQQNIGYNVLKILSGIPYSSYSFQMNIVIKNQQKKSTST